MSVRSPNYTDTPPYWSAPDPASGNAPSQQQAGQIAPGQTPTTTYQPNSLRPTGPYNPDANAPPTTPAATPPAAGGGGARPDPSQIIQGWFTSLPATSASLEKILEDLKAKGYDAKRATHAGGQLSDDKIIVDGKMYDLIQDVGGPGARWAFQNVDSGGGGGVGGGPVAATPMILPNGQVPPGLPYTPGQGAQNPFFDQQNQLYQNFLSQPVYDQNYINSLNEQQKELILGQGQAQQQAASQGAIHRGVSQGGPAAAAQRRISDEITRNLLQSQRDVRLQTTGANRQGFLDALTGSENLTGSRFNRDAAMRQFIEGMRQFDTGTQQSYDLANLDAELAYLSGLR